MCNNMKTKTLFFVFFWGGVKCPSYGHSSNSQKYESSIYGMKGW